MKIISLCLVLAVPLLAFSTFAQGRPCASSDPHSFICQRETFDGKVFPMIQPTQNRMVGNWRPLVYAVAPGQPAFFHSRFSEKNPRIPTGVINADSTPSGPLQWPDEKSILYAHFRQAKNHIKQNTSLRTIDNQTVQVIFANTREGSQERLTCRLFQRVNVNHLLCEWTRDGRNGSQFLGFLGFVK